MDRDEERAGRREPGREDDLRGTEDVRDEDERSKAYPSKGESGGGGLGAMVRRGAMKLAREPRAQRTAKQGSSSLGQRLLRR